MTTIDQQVGQAATTPEMVDGAGPQAVIVVTNHGGASRAFRDTDAGPAYLIAVVAHFVTWADDHRLPCTVDTWLAYTATFPGALPCRDSTDDDPGDDDVDYRYDLVLHGDSGGVLVRVDRLRGLAWSARPRLEFELTRANLFAEAGLLCELMARRAQEWADDHDGAPPAGNDPAVWHRHAARFDRIHASTAVTALEANAMAQSAPATFDVPYPAIQVVGAQVFAYVDEHGTLQIAVHLETTERWLLRGDGTVPIQVRIQDTVVFDG